MVGMTLVLILVMGHAEDASCRNTVIMVAAEALVPIVLQAHKTIVKMHLMVNIVWEGTGLVMDGVALGVLTALNIGIKR
jgi:hypothetical protein